MEDFKDILLGGKPFKVGSGGSIVTSAGRILKPETSNRGYSLVEIWPLNKKMRVHRLVAMCHVPNPLNKPQVNHINGIKSDNRAINLEWVTDSENKFHAHRNGLYKKRLLGN